MFFKVKIKNTGSLARIGNFFLAPARLLLPGSKTVIVKDDGSIAKVSSFEREFLTPDFLVTPGKESKQDPRLHSHKVWHLTTYLLSVIIVIPFTIIGSIFKLFSYTNSKALKAHALVKEKLTPQEKRLALEDKPVAQNRLRERLHPKALTELGKAMSSVIQMISAPTAQVAQDKKSDSENRSLTAESLRDKLYLHLMTGQKTGTLVISGKGALDDECVHEISLINPSKLILNGVEIKTEQLKHDELGRYDFSDQWRWEKWDASALRGNDNHFSSLQEALDYSPGFFNRKHKRMICVVNNTVKEDQLTSKNIIM